MYRKFSKAIIKIICAFALWPVMGCLVVVAVLSRYRVKRIDIGLGPEPLINNVYHKRALQLYGYTAETFVSHVYFITEDFDIRGDLCFTTGFISKFPLLPTLFKWFYLICLSLWRYRCLYIYFNGGPLGIGFRSRFLHRLEPYLYKLARTRVVVMPYGGDVDEMSRACNLTLKNALCRDYPCHRLRRRLTEAQIDRWTQHADHVISGNEWVDYMYHWDTLMLNHFSIDTDRWRPPEEPHISLEGKLRFLHAPNHRTIKGTKFFIDAVNELIQEGLDIELVLLEQVPNDEIFREMATVDIVADQLIMGWYAMFAIEAMAMAKPVLCYIRDDLRLLYFHAGLLAPDELPLVNCTPSTVKDVIRDLATNREKLADIGRRSREYVLKHHSLKAVGAVFDRINRSIGVTPSGAPPE